MALSQGTILYQRYRIVGLLGQGGFGTVYRAWDLNLRRPCAIKENLEATTEAQRQFQREARLLANLNHPNLPRVTDHFFVRGQGQYLVMDFVEGEDLQTKLDSNQGQPLHEAQVLPWIEQVNEALTYLHTQKPPVIHRDIKPANIKITPDGKAMLVDFGIAKIYDPTHNTTAGAQAVTPGYSPPEQYGSGKTDAQSDVYAIGATTYALLTGQAPPSSVEIISETASPPQETRLVNPSVSLNVSDAVARAMQLNREQRTRSVAEFQAALVSPVREAFVATAPAMAAGYQATQVATNVPSPPQVTPGRKIPWVWIGAAAAALLIVAVGFFALRGGNSSNTDEEYATLPAVVVVAELTDTPSPTLEATATIDLFTPTPVFSETPAPTSAPTETPIPSSSPTPVGPPAQIVDDVGVPMVLVPAGSFQMGGEAETSHAECQKLRVDGNCEFSKSEDEEPGHTVKLDDYYIDQFEVTNVRYAECVTDGDCAVPNEYISLTRSSYYDNPDYADYPVIYVNWHQADAYCEWRGARLPSEAEWEKAARGTDGRIYPWGNTFDGTKGNFCDTNCTSEYPNQDYDDGYADTAPVGSYPEGASPYGALDLAGNVWEWTASLYLPYPYDPDGGREDSSSSGLRVSRGGGLGWNMMSTNRFKMDTALTGFDLGFRCANSVVQPHPP